MAHASARSHSALCLATASEDQRSRTFPNGTATHVAIRTNLLSDVYAAIGDPDPNGGHVLRLYYNPLVPLIWLGAMAMALGGLVSLSDRRHRVGAPSRRRREFAAIPAQAAE